jgi:hypothetical protein
LQSYRHKQFIKMRNPSVAMGTLGTKALALRTVPNHLPIRDTQPADQMPRHGCCSAGLAGANGGGWPRG